MTLDAQSPYALVQRRALKNMLRARRAQDTLIGAYCDNPSSEAAWNRLGQADATFERCRAIFALQDERHRAWILNQLRAH